MAGHEPRPGFGLPMFSQPSTSRIVPPSLPQQQQQQLPPQVFLPVEQRRLQQFAAAQPLLPVQGLISADARLLLKARTSWLKAAEVSKLLRLGFCGSLPLSPIPADLPTAGTLYLYDRKRVRYFRADGHNWRKRPDGSSARETHEKLRVENVDKLNCYYARAVEPADLQRRCYWLLEDDSLVLVHYLEAEGGSARGARESAARQGSGLWNETGQSGLLADELERGPGRPDGQRCHTSAGKFEELHPPHASLCGQEYTRASLEDRWARRHSSLDESRESFTLTPANYPGQQQQQQQHQEAQIGRHWPWAAPAGQLNGPRDVALPWTAAEMEIEHMHPVGPIPQGTAHQQAAGLMSQHSGSQGMYVSQQMDMDRSMAHQHSGADQGHNGARASMDDCIMSAPSQLFHVVEMSHEVVSARGGDKVLLVGNIASACDVRGGVTVEVDGVQCSAQIIHTGVISFVTQPHPPGIANVIIRNSYGQLMSSSVCLRFA